MRKTRLIAKCNEAGQKTAEGGEGEHTFDNTMKAGQSRTQNICEQKCPRAAASRENEREKLKETPAVYHDEKNRTKEYRTKEYRTKEYRTKEYRTKEYRDSWVQ